MDEVLTAQLLAASALTALVGTRITWEERPQLEALPSITLTVSSAPRAYHHAGASNLQRSRIQADIWGARAADVLAIKRALITAVEGLNTSKPAPIAGAFIENSFATEPEDMGGGAKVFRRIVEFFVWHSGQ